MKEAGTKFESFFVWMMFGWKVGFALETVLSRVASGCAAWRNAVCSREKPGDRRLLLLWGPSGLLQRSRRGELEEAIFDILRGVRIVHECNGAVSVKRATAASGQGVAVGVLERLFSVVSQGFGVKHVRLPRVESKTALKSSPFTSRIRDLGFLLEPESMDCEDSPDCAEFPPPDPPRSRAFPVCPSLRISTPP